MRKNRCIVLFACLLALVIGGSTISPAGTVLAAVSQGKKKPPQTLQVIFSRYPTSNICMPGVQEIHYVISTPNGKYTGVGIQVGSSLGTVDSFAYDTNTGTGSFFYYPKNEGQENLTINATKGNLKANDKASFFNENCTYKVYIKGLYEVNTSDTQLYAKLDGEGSFTKDPETGTPSGDGTASLAEDLSTDAKAVACKLTPTVNMQFSFQVVEGMLAPLQPLTPVGKAPTSGKAFVINLDFNESEYPELSINCVTIEGKDLNLLKIPSGRADLNSIIDVENMYFSSEGGEHPFKFSKGSGTVTVVPKVKER